MVADAQSKGISRLCHSILARAATRAEARHTRVVVHEVVRRAVDRVCERDSRRARELHQALRGLLDDMRGMSSQLNTSRLELSASRLHYRLYKGTAYEQYCDTSEWAAIENEA